MLLLLCILGILDYLSGFEISFAFFYLLPVCLAAWTMSRGAAFFVSFVSAVVWQMANSLAGEQWSTALVSTWNTGTRLGFFFVVSWLLAALRKALDHEAQAARTDFLTGLLNSRAFYEIAELEFKRADRYRHPVTIAYIDVDDFKLINDQFSHSVGDEVLQSVGRTLLRHVRATDSIARLGGDEFSLLLPETDREAAEVLVQRLRQDQLEEMEKRKWEVTFSIGVLTCATPPGDVHEMIRMADQVMYEAKNSGKNAVRYSVNRRPA